MKRLIYADNAATTKLDTEAFEAMKPYLLDEYGNASQPYSFGVAAKEAIKKARNTIAECIGAQPEDIYFTSGGTESDNWAIKGSAFSDSEKKATITSRIEHHAVLNSCVAIERLGYPVAYLPVNQAGIVEVKSLSRYITNTTRLVSIMMASNEIGTIEPIKELCELAHEHGAIFHTDAVQGVGHIPINVQYFGVDMLSASAHKFNGPKGIGFLYIKKGTNLCSYNDGGAQEFGMRAGTENVASIVGMAVALKNNVREIDTNKRHLLSLENLLLSKIGNLDYVRNGADNHIPGNMSLSFGGADGEALLHRLDLKGICISTGSACDSVNTQISHVLQAIILDERYAKGTVRISFGKYNTEDDIIQIADALHKVVGK